MSEFLSAELQDDDYQSEVKLRPSNFSEYVGQRKIVQNIELMVEASKLRKGSMDHVLLSGPPGLGKTSLAMIIAKELGVGLHVISGPALEKKGDLAALLTNLAPRDVLFIDEIHRLHISIEEILYSAMEDFRLDIIMGQGVSARTMQIDLVPFTLIGATTRAGLLSNPLRDRFQAQFSYDFYQDDELAAIIHANAKKLDLDIEEEALLEMAKRSRGTPRVANRILRRVRDYVLVKRLSKATAVEVDKSLSLLEIDELGLGTLDRKILQVMNEYYGGGPVGIDALCATLGESRDTIEEVHEPFLLKEGLIIRTPRGRQLSEKGKKHIILRT